MNNNKQDSSLKKIIGKDTPSEKACFVALLLISTISIIATTSYWWDSSPHKESEVISPSRSAVLPTELPIDSSANSSWEEYKDNEYDFTLIYPKDWEVRTNGFQENAFEKNLALFSKINAASDSSHLTVALIEGTLEQFIENPDGPSYFSISVSDLSPFNVGTKAALKTESASEAFYTHGDRVAAIDRVHIFVPFKDKHLYFEYATKLDGSELSSDSLNTIREIIDSLSFGSQNQAEETRAHRKWNMYADNDYGFAFKYPDAWEVQAEYVNSPHEKLKRIGFRINDKVVEASPIFVHVIHSTMEDYLAWEREFGSHGGVVSSQEAKLADRKAIKRITEGQAYNQETRESGVSRGVSYLIPYNDYIISVYYTTDPFVGDVSPETLTAINIIVNSFLFF